MSKIVAVVPEDFRLWAEHIDRLFAESGRDGQPLFSPFEQAPNVSSPERRTRFERSLALPVRHPGWMRAWSVRDQDQRIIGHLDLFGSNIPSENHRMTLGIGCELSFRRRGMGTVLMRHAIDFALENAIEWIDLFVFSDNAAAVALYRRFGFVDTGRRSDRFRLMGRTVDDVMMTLHVPLSAEPVRN
ncbi:GNAT family N-acetyltransferase [Paraburkholderia humisilvae]|uniref:GNAT family N-acetyltransferase n=1 Tax=Paraburkholderia humisilvae TaxID=627669 RepID=UPI001582199E|nr:GNAT family N-acetyltransferase [Paraburkholderia humisilvae]